MAEEQNTSKKNTPLYCGIGSVVLVIVLLLLTEVIFDSSVLLQWILLLFLIVGLVPFFLSKLSNRKMADMISIGCFVFTLVVCMTLFYRRNKVTKVFLSDEPTEDEIAKLEGYLKPSGVLIVAGVSSIKLKDTKLMPLLVPTEATLSGFKKSLEKLGDSDLSGTKLTVPLDKLGKVRLSGYQKHLLFYMPTVDETQAKERGFKML